MTATGWSRGGLVGGCLPATLLVKAKGCNGATLGLHSPTEMLQSMRRSMKVNGCVAKYHEWEASG